MHAHKCAPGEERTGLCVCVCCGEVGGGEDGERLTTCHYRGGRAMERAGHRVSPPHWQGLPESYRLADNNSTAFREVRQAVPALIHTAW